MVKRLLAVASMAVLLAGCSASTQNDDARSAAGEPSLTPSEGDTTALPTASPSPPSAAADVEDTPSPAPAARAFPIKGCEASYGRTHHDYPASDIFANEGCAIVSVVTGIVNEVSRRDTWTPDENDGATRGGLSVSIIGYDGVRYYYSHFSTIRAGIEPGRAVAAGERLGEVGRTGSARGTSPHLHFGLSWPTPRNVWWVRRGELQTAPYLDAWRDGRDKSPVRPIEKLQASRGDVPRCAAAC